MIFPSHKSNQFNNLNNSVLTIKVQNNPETRLKILFIPTLPVKAEFIAMLRIQNNTGMLSILHSAQC